MIKQQEGIVLDTVIDVGDEEDKTTIVHKADKTGKSAGKTTIVHEADKTTIVHEADNKDK